MTSTVTVAKIGRIIAAAAGIALLAVVLTDHDQLTAVFGGIGSGALYAAIALGVVLTYKGSGVVNFANGATAMYVAYIYDSLRTQGQIFLPPLPNPLALVEGALHAAGATGVSLPDWPTQIGTGTPMAFGPAMLISLAASVVLGLLFHYLIFRPLPRRTAPGQGRGFGWLVHPAAGDRHPALHLAGAGHRAHHAQGAGALPR